MSSYAENASSVMRALEFLVDKHCKGIDKPAAPKVSKEVLAAIPRVARRTVKPAVRVTVELHDAVYAEATTTFRSHADLEKRFNISSALLRRIASRRHPLYDAKRSEEFRYAHLKKSAA